MVKIREDYWDQDVTQQALADEYDVDRTMVGLIVRGKCWAEAGGPVMGEDYPEKIRAYHKLTPELVQEARVRYHNEDIAKAKLARQYNVTPTNMAKVLRGDTWKDVGGPLSD